MTHRRHNAAVLLAGIACLVVAVGVARFSFTSQLPAMLADFLTVSQTGMLAVVNFSGYTAGSLMAVFVRQHNHKIIWLRAGLLLCIASTFLLAVDENIYRWALWRLLAGFGSAWLLVLGSAVVMASLRFDDVKNDSRNAMGIHFSGIGVAIALCDVIAKSAQYFGFDWQAIWIFETALGLLLAPVIILNLPKQPKAATAAVLHFDFKIFTPLTLLLLFAYGTEGVGFAVQATFLPDIINAIIPNFGTWAWLAVGIAGILSCVLQMRLAMHIGSMNMIMIAMLLQIVGILLPTLSSNIYLNLLSGALFGVTFIGLVALFMHLGGKLAAHNPALMMGALTAVYGIGLIGAPFYSVLLKNHYHSYNPALYLTAAIVALGIGAIFVGKKYSVAA